MSLLESSELLFDEAHVGSFKTKFLYFSKANVILVSLKAASSVAIQQEVKRPFCLYDGPV